MASADVIRYSLYSNSTTDTIKYSIYSKYSINDQLLKEFASLVVSIFDTRNKNIKDFVNVYTTAVDYTYKIDDPILLRHFLLETVEDINDDLIKNNKPYRVDFGYDMLAHFLNENDAYFEKKEFYDDDDGTFSNFKLLNRIETLDKMVGSWTLGNKLFLYSKKVETDLAVLYL